MLTPRRVIWNGYGSPEAGAGLAAMVKCARNIRQDRPEERCGPISKQLKNVTQPCAFDILDTRQTSVDQWLCGVPI